MSFGELTFVHMTWNQKFRFKEKGATLGDLNDRSVINVCHFIFTSFSALKVFFFLVICNYEV